MADPIKQMARDDALIDAACERFDKTVGTGLRPVSAAELISKQFPELHWNIHGILPAGTMLLFGKPKKGKSLLTLLIAVSVAAGKPVFGRETSGRPVLYMALEDSDRRAQRRLKGCSNSLGIDPAEFADRLHIVTDASRIDAGLVDDLHDWMKAHPDTGLIVVDMLKKVTASETGGDLYKVQSLVGDSLTKFSHGYPELSIIVVHHSRKAESDDPFDLVSGTTGLSGSFDSLAAISELNGQRVLHMTGRDIEGMDVPLLMGGSGMYSLAMPEPDEAQAALMSETRRRVYHAVPSSMPMDRAGIVEGCGLDGPAVDQQLRKLIGSGHIRRIDHGKYQKTNKQFLEDPFADVLPFASK